MSKKSTRGSSTPKTERLSKSKKKKLTFLMVITALLTVLFLFVICGICFTGEELKNSLVIFSSVSSICTTALFMSFWIDHR